MPQKAKDKKCLAMATCPRASNSPKLTRTSVQIFMSSPLISTQRLSASFWVDALDSVAAWVWIAETVLHDERRAPTTFLNATESKFRSYQAKQ